jgi:copper homeostasis protein CutC
MKRAFDKLFMYVTLWCVFGVGVSIVSYAQTPDPVDIEQGALIRANERDIQRNTAALAMMTNDIRELRSAMDRQSGIVLGFGIAFTAIQFGIFVLQWKRSTP